jgi:hypothetical protein
LKLYIAVLINLSVNPKIFWGLVGLKTINKKGSLPSEMEFNGNMSSDAKVTSDFLTHIFIIHLIKMYM